VRGALESREGEERGVTVEQMRAALGIAWCPRCRQECLPHRERCMFCDAKVKPLPQRPAGASC